MLCIIFAFTSVCHRKVNDKIGSLSGNPNRPKAGVITPSPRAPALTLSRAFSSASSVVLGPAPPLPLPSLPRFRPHCLSLSMSRQSPAGLLRPFWNLHRSTLSCTQVGLCHPGACPRWVPVSHVTAAFLYALSSPSVVSRGQGSCRPCAQSWVRCSEGAPRIFAGRKQQPESQTSGRFLSLEDY